MDLILKFFILRPFQLYTVTLFSLLFYHYIAITGIQKHIALSSLGVPLGLYADKKVDERSARRDAALIQYMKLHPERFPEAGTVFYTNYFAMIKKMIKLMVFSFAERTKFKDVLQPWIPLR